MLGPSRVRSRQGRSADWKGEHASHRVSPCLDPLVSSKASSPRERNHVDSQLSQIRVELTRETKARRDTRHDDGDELIEITICRCVKLECSEANVVQGFVVNAEGLVGVLNELVDGESGVVRLDDGVGDCEVTFAGQSS